MKITTTQAAEFETALSNFRCARTELQTFERDIYQPASKKLEQDGPHPSKPTFETFFAIEDQLNEAMTKVLEAVHELLCAPANGCDDLRAKLEIIEAESAHHFLAEESDVFESIKSDVIRLN